MADSPEVFHTVKNTVAKQASTRLATILKDALGKATLTAATATSTNNTISTTCKHTNHIQSRSRFKPERDVVW